VGNARLRFSPALLVLVQLAVPVAAEATDAASRVDPLIGTGAHGHTFPGPTLPFGMVQLSPDTRLEGWDGCSGYHDTDRVIYGFSHTHLSGTGIPDYGDVLLMPVTGEPHLDNGYRSGPDHGYASRFDKATERASAGWYAVHLADYGVDVELTATERTGLHRYRFPDRGQAWVILDLEHRDEVIDASLRLIGDREIEGHRRSTGWARDQVVYFVARFSRPFARAELASNEAVLQDASRVEGKRVKARLAFGEPGGELLVRVGISAVDVEGARRNLESEQGERGFEEVRRAAHAAWNRALGKIDVAGGTDEQQEIFYSALYHAMIAPNVWSDVDGRYRGMDGHVHRAEGRRQYTVFSLWDTFRATHPLYTLIEPERAREFIETFLAQYEQGGRLPVWELAANETDTMIGYHSVPVIVDAWVKGIRGFNAQRALRAMEHSATLDHFGLAAYRRQGFIGSEDNGESVSKTLEYAFDDFCIARLARELGDIELATRFERRSQGWRHLLDPETGFMRARRNQRWVEPFDPYRVDNNYTEANAWQYSMFVPHDLESLIETLGGDEAFVGRLDAVFEADSRTTGRDQADITGLIGQYAHGNEPSHHMAWLYHYAGAPGRSAERVRQIRDGLYGAGPDGLSGNEDCGQMSSWYVFAAIGFYPVTPCADQYVLGVPLFERVRLNMDSGRSFEIRTQGVSPAGTAYVTEAKLNGQPLSRSFLQHAEIVRGGTLVLTLATEPSDTWGVPAKDRPPSRVPGPPLPAAPFVRSESDRFHESLTVELGSAEPGATIRCSLVPGKVAGRQEAADSSIAAVAGPDESWQICDGPVVVRDSTTIRFVAERDGRQSPTVEAYLHRIPNDWTVVSASDPAPQYSLGGAPALIDGLRGEADWRTGGWLGFQTPEFAAVVDLGRRRTLRRVGASFLQDQRAWIWMPAEVVVSISDDGVSFRETARIATDVDPAAPGVVLRDVTSTMSEHTEARYVRIRARRLAAIPEWHPGRGGTPWIFVDELIVDD